MRRAVQIRKSVAKTPFLVAAASVIIGLGAFSGEASALTKKRGMLIIDASSSMSGALAGGGAARRVAPAGLKVEGIAQLNRPVTRSKNAVSKLRHVQNTLSKAYGDFRNRVNLGVLAFGSSSPDSCSDIRAIKNLGAINPAAYLAATRKIAAKGVSPITAAVQKAATMADYKNSINTLVLITDSVDSCGMNPCKLGGELRNSGANITVHVIGIGLPTSQQTNLRCLAGHTRGHYFDVRSRQQLTQAIYGAMNAISISSNLTPETPPTPEVIAAAQKSPGKVVGVEKLDVVPMPRRKPRKPKTADTAPEQPEAPVKTAEAPASMPEPPAPKKDTAAPQAKPPVISEEQPVISAAKPAQAGNGGRLSVQARIIDGTPPLTAGLTWSIFKADAGAPSQKVADSKQAIGSFDLKPGDYVVESRLDYARVRDFVSIKAGENASSDLVFNAGGLSLSTVLAGKPPANASDVSYTVSERNTGRIVVKNLSSNQVIHLNAGDYEVISRYGNANAIVKANLSIQAGKLTEATLNHNAGRISLKLAGDENGPALKDVSWEVQKSNGSTVASSTSPQPGYVLAAGAYKVVAKHDGKVYRSSLMIRPGENTTKTLTTK
ncbi:MAG: hypothetical protein C0605_16675 [Hyphomicrobiales bacterium]|nr:MAG: hypothetical protein C0605_16675 [Hyphomicrobiales bacterium]